MTFTVLDASGANVTFKSTNTASVETQSHNAQLQVQNSYVSSLNPVPASLSVATGGANIAVTATNPLPVGHVQSNAIVTNTNPVPVQVCLSNAIVSNTNAVPVQTGYPQWTTSWGVSGIPVPNTDGHSAVWSVTDAPASGKKLVIDEITISVDVPMRVDLKCETSGAVVAGPYYLAGNTTLNLSPGKNNKGWKLATADKKLQAQTGATGNISIFTAYHSET
jgi:hypothetical protein